MINFAPSFEINNGLNKKSHDELTMDPNLKYFSVILTGHAYATPLAINTSFPCLYWSVLLFRMNTFM